MRSDLHLRLLETVGVSARIVVLFTALLYSLMLKPHIHKIHTFDPPPSSLRNLIQCLQSHTDKQLQKEVTHIPTMGTRSRPSLLKREAIRRESMRLQKKLDAEATSKVLQSTTFPEPFFARKRELSAKLHAMTPTLAELNEKYYVLAFEHKNQHIVLQTSPRSFSTHIEQMLEGNDDNAITASVLDGPIICTNNSSVHVKTETRKYMVAHSFPMCTIPTALIEILQKSNDILNLAWPSATIPQQGTRGLFSVRHLACWWKVGRNKLPYMSSGYLGTSRNAADRQLRGQSVPDGFIVPDNVDPDVEVFLRSNERLWGLIDSLVKTHYPEEFNVLTRLALPQGCVRVAGIFTGLAINNHVKTYIHRDSGDWPLGICVVVSFGNAKGGQLALREEVIVAVEHNKIYDGVILPGSTGSITIFRSALVRHFNVDYSDGQRHSIVLFTDNALMRYQSNKSISL